ncbi:DUF6323 family protein [Anaerosporobacter sp.]|uniref:DUF6323 family protein n=1 Tax=Anaerosporobacter sp. TaxID=1872529 RepID=UPI00286F139D|nr:DUF6323 family protein [Anaerosporobacter sp.]
MDDYFELMLQEQKRLELERVLSCNQKTEQFGLTLTPEDANALMETKQTSLKENRRVELGNSVLPEIIFAFCDSAYINQDNYVNTISELQEIFFLFKNEALDELTDDELLTFMKEQFETVCFGDLDYLRSTCLERFSRGIRCGYKTQSQKRLRDEYEMRPIENEYRNFDEETHWENELFYLKLEDLF